MSNETKRCPKCERELSTEQFNKRANGRCYAYCKACQSVYARNHYVNHIPAYYKRRLDSNQRSILRNRSFAIEHLRTHPCVDCGENDPIVLEFDHIDPSTKVDAVSDLIRCAYSLERVKSEMERCEVRCVNCHRRRTARQFFWNMRSR